MVGSFPPIYPFFLHIFRRNIERSTNFKRKKKKSNICSRKRKRKRDRIQEEETSCSLTERVYGASLQKCNSPADDALKLQRNDAGRTRKRDEKHEERRRGGGMGGSNKEMGFGGR